MMKEGVRMKFTSDPELKNYLISTGEKDLIELNPNDSFWGIECSMHSQKARDPKNWGKIT